MTLAELDDARFLRADADRGTAPRFWKVAGLDQPRARIAAAHLTATAHGVYEARIDGHAVSGSVLDRDGAPTSGGSPANAGTSRR